jgi:mitochondrial enoyl-[acyl-carrier protein] reductase / trans-2-enoyl-CoA reductase
MKVIRYFEFGSPEDVLRVVEEPVPQPGAGEVRIRLEASPVHLADLKHIRGLPWFDQYKPPHVPGYEGVGRISAVGQGVQGVKEGDRVFLPVRFGAWSEEIVANAQGLWRAPEGIPAEQLALIPINFSTAYLLLRHVVPLVPGDWVMQNAANSNVGYYLIRLCRQWGLSTVNVVRRPELLAGLDGIGGTLNLVDGDDLAERVQAVVPRGGRKLAIDAIAGDAPTRLGRCFGGVGGTVVSYGLLSGEPCRIPPEMLMLDAVTLTGFFAARTLEQLGAAAVEDIQGYIRQLLEADPPNAPIAGRYPLEQVHSAVRHAAQVGAGREGKIVLMGET